MTGKLIGIFLVAAGLIAGVAVYWLQVYAFYDEVPAPEIRLTTLSGSVEPILAENVEAIDADSSPIRFRACFETPQSQAMLTETYVTAADPVPLNAPGWFDCFDAAEIGAALETGDAVAFLSEAEIRPGVDRLVAVFPDGRGYAWHQLTP